MITAKFKNLFLDRAHVIKKIGEARVKVLKKSGSRIRLTAQRSMRYRKRASAAGSPPSAHKESGALLRKLLFFVYDFASDSVVVGPVSARRAEVPPLQEFGGTKALKSSRVVRVGGPGRNEKGQFVDGKRVRLSAGTILRYPPRPYMAPALSKIEPSLPKEWSNSVVGP